jgi:hypothetical protein
MNKRNWLTIAVLGTVGVFVLLASGSLLFLARGGWGSGRTWIGIDGCGAMGNWRHWGMMGSRGFGSLGWALRLMGLLVPLSLLGLLAMGVTWLFRRIAPSQRAAVGVGTAQLVQHCPGCDRPVQADWQLCPHCGQSLVE